MSSEVALILQAACQKLRDNSFQDRQDLQVDPVIFYTLTLLIIFLDIFPGCHLPFFIHLKP